MSLCCCFVMNVLALLRSACPFHITEGSTRALPSVLWTSVASPQPALSPSLYSQVSLMLPHPSSGKGPDLARGCHGQQNLEFLVI